MKYLVFSNYMKMLLLAYNVIWVTILEIPVPGLPNFRNRFFQTNGFTPSGDIHKKSVECFSPVADGSLKVFG